MPSKPRKHDIPYSTYIRTINYNYGPEGKKNPRITYGIY